MPEGLSADWLSWGFQREQALAGIRPINARVETAASKQLFRDAWGSRRCLVPADGWYEWREEQAGKQPYYFQRQDGEPLWFAGLWSGNTFAILTMAADGKLAQIHSRRPLALDLVGSRIWIETSQKGAPGAIPAAELEFYPVSSRVSNPRNDGADLIRQTAPLPIPARLELDLFPNPE